MNISWIPGSRRGWAVALLGVCAGLNVRAAETVPSAPKLLAPGLVGEAKPGAPGLGFEELLERARAAQARGLPKQALELADQAVAAAPKEPRTYHYRSQIHTRLREFAPAEADLSRTIQLHGQEPGLYYERGLVRFRMADFVGSIADLDRFAEMRPARAPDLWQRGIAYFYAGRYDDGRRQFELHRTVNPDDVENSAWHYACVARLEGAASARAKWIPVSGDGRVPMAQVQAVMSGKGTPEAVLKAAEAIPEGERREAALLYAHLYLSLHFGAEGRRDLEARHAAEASKRSQSEGMMGDVARLHADWVTAQMAKAAR